MTRGTKILLAVVLGAMLLSVATVTLGAAVAYRAGSVSVSIQDPYDDFSIRVPAILANVALSLAPRSTLDEIAGELGPFLPALEAALDELQATGDFVLVEVVSGEEQVLIEKRGGSLQIRVRGDGSEVRVSLPLATVGSVCHRFRSGSRRAA